MISLLSSLTVTGLIISGRYFSNKMRIQRCMTNDQLLKNKIILEDTLTKTETDNTEIVHSKAKELTTLARENEVIIRFDGNLGSTSSAIYAENTIIFSIRDMLEKIPISNTECIKSSYLATFYHELGHLKLSQVPHYLQISVCSLTTWATFFIAFSPPTLLSLSLIGGLNITCLVSMFALSKYHEWIADKYMLSRLKGDNYNLDLWKREQNMHATYGTLWSRLTHPIYKKFS